MVKEIFGFDIKIDRRYDRPTFVVFWVGSHDDHLMDWRGCNFRRIKAKVYNAEDDSILQPVFHELWEAVQQAVKPVFPVAIEEPYSIPMIPKDTLDTIVNTYMGISPESLIGIRAKNGKTLTSNDARYLFKNLMENMGSIQKLYPGKKFTIAGQGQWKSIEIK